MPTALVYNEAKRQLMAGELALDTDDIRAILVMANSTCPNENAGKTRLAHFSEIDEYDGSGYSRQALASKAVNVNSTQNRAQFSSAQLEFGSAAAGSRSAIGVLIYKRVDGTAANDVPLVYVPLDAATPGSGSPFVVTCPAGGWWQIS